MEYGRLTSKSTFLIDLSHLKDLPYCSQTYWSISMGGLAASSSRSTSANLIAVRLADTLELLHLLNIKKIK